MTTRAFSIPSPPWRALAALSWVLALGACQVALETHDGTVGSGNRALIEGRVDEARARYDEAATALPESPALNYLRGLAASATGDHKSAADYLLRALDTRDKAFEQRIKAALGLTYAREAIALERSPGAAPQPDGVQPDGGAAATDPAATALDRWKLAARFLAEALVLDPMDLESRRSLEVALLRVDPPCATRDDDFEPNDSREAARLLEVGADQTAEAPVGGGAEGAAPAAGQAQAAARDVLRFRKQLFSCPDDPDWFALELAAGDRVELAVTVPKEAGALEFELLSPDGASAGAIPVTGEKRRFTVTSELAGRWHIAQRNVDLDEVGYGLEVVVRPACNKTEDAFEDNDADVHAKTITPGAVPDLKLCPGDEDWYALELAEGESLFLYAQPDPTRDEGDEKKKAPEDQRPTVPGLELEVLDIAGMVRARGAPNGLSRISALLTPGPGRYLIRVRSADRGFGPDGTEPFEGRYNLQVAIVPPCPEGDDRFEDNDIAEDATDFMQAATPEQAQSPEAMLSGGGAQQGPPVVFARICPGDEDWWSFTSTGEKPEIIGMTFDHAKGDLDLVLWDETASTELMRSETSSEEQNAEAVALPMAPKAEAPGPGADAPVVTPEAKVYKLQVLGRGEGENFYLLRLDQPSGGGGDSADGDPEENDDQDQDERDPSERDQSEGDKPADEPRNPLREALDKLDKNPENLQARDAANKSPLATQKPLKDW